MKNIKDLLLKCTLFKNFWIAFYKYFVTNWLLLVLNKCVQNLGLFSQVQDSQSILKPGIIREFSSIWIMLGNFIFHFWLKNEKDAKRGGGIKGSIHSIKGQAGCRILLKLCGGKPWNYTYYKGFIYFHLIKCHQF